MRKFILYALLLAFLVALGTLVFGFWNARNIRVFAERSKEIKAENDLSGEIEEAEKIFLSEENNDPQEVQKKTTEIRKKLEEISSRAENAKTSINRLRTPKFSEAGRAKLSEYYAKTAEEARNLESVATFMGRALDVSLAFREMGDNADLAEIRNRISGAREKNAAVKADELPEELRTSGQNLLESMGTFLVKMEGVAAKTNEDIGQLEDAYADFALKEKDFTGAMDRYIAGFPDLAPLGKSIDADMEKMERVYFSLR